MSNISLFFYDLSTRTTYHNLSKLYFFQFWSHTCTNSTGCGSLKCVCKRPRFFYRSKRAMSSKCTALNNLIKLSSKILRILCSLYIPILRGADLRNAYVTDTDFFTVVRGRCPLNVRHSIIGLSCLLKFYNFSRPFPTYIYQTLWISEMRMVFSEIFLL
jgi:hypothetical protein